MKINIRIKVFVYKQLSHYLELSILTICLPVINEGHDRSADCNMGQTGSRGGRLSLRGLSLVEV